MQNQDENPDSAKPGLYIKTFGCQMNEYDSEKVRALLPEYRRVASPEEAHLVFVNSCSVREKGEQKLRSLLGELKELKSKNPELIVGIGGCVAQQEGHEMMSQDRGIDFIVGTHNLSLVPTLARRARAGTRGEVAVDYRDEWEELPLDFDSHGAEQTSVRALIAIQRGCDKRCAFCVVPTTRGPEVSRDPREIYREIRAKVLRGAKEVVLLGQTVNSYGKDLTPRYSFSTLVREIAELPGIERIRFTSPHPAEVRDDFIKLYGEIPQLCAHIHMPLQSGSDRILKLMNRNYRRDRYLSIIEEVRAQSARIAVTTDIIVGFPTETEDDFEETLDIVRRVKYATAYYFKYSRRPNTVAIERFGPKDEIPREVADDRFSRLDSLITGLSFEYNKAMVGEIHPVLVEGTDSRISSILRGRIPQNTIVEFDAGPSPIDTALVGTIVSVAIEAASPRNLRGRIHS